MKNLLAPTTSRLLAWCSQQNNRIKIINLDKKEDYAVFDGVPLKNKDGNFIFISENEEFTLYSELDACQRNRAYKIAYLSPSLSIRIC